MRVICGCAHGRRLRAPRGSRVRPTADRVKEAIFNILNCSWDGLSVLDLFAGSGALGIESLSRGGAEAVFVELDPRCIRVLRENLKNCGLEARAKVIRMEAVRFLNSRRVQERFDVIFADPPYERGLVNQCIQAADRGGWLAPSGRLVIEHSCRESLSKEEGTLVLCDQRAYGDTRISIIKPREKGEARGER